MLTQLEYEILEECAGERAPRPWGAAVGATLEYLRKTGHLTDTDALTIKGREVLDARKNQP